MSSSSSFAHYTIAEKIGAGGMGEVFRATDSRLGREVALKMLPDAMVANPERLARFQREAKVLAALNHPGIAAIYGLESQGQRNALAMELVTGPDLSEKLLAGPVSVDEGLRIALQLAEAIEAAHEKGIVHRDLKPANIKINDEGRVKVLDFGLAKALADDPAGSAVDTGMSPTLTANMTMGHVILGTAAYMSPEQARGTDVDKRADIWAFGVVVAEMLGGKRLFHGETVSDTLASVLKSAIELDDLPAALPSAVTRLLRRCLQRDPKQRLRDIGDARIILQEVISGATEEAADEVPAQRSGWLQWAVTGAVAIAAMAAMYFFMPRGEETSLPLRKFAIPMDPEDVSTSLGFAPQISPDGQYLLYVSGNQLWVRDLASMVARPLTGTDAAHLPFWSPDSEWIGFANAHELKKIDRSGGQSAILAKVSGNTSPASAGSAVWNNDGTIFYTTGNSGILKSSAQSGEVTMHQPPGEGEVDFHEICSLPEGRGWIYVVHTKEDYGRLKLLTPDGQAKEILHYPGDAINSPVWSPSGHLVFERELVAEGLWAIPFSLDRLEVTGEPFLVAAGGTKPSISADGTLVYAAGVRPGSVELAWYDNKGQLLETIAEVSTFRPFPALSPDETKILLCANADDGREIWLFDTTNGNERRLTFEGLRWGMAAWHPDGNRIYSYIEPDYDGFMMTLDGSEPRKEMGQAVLFNISNDGQTFFYSRANLEEGFNFDIYARPLDAPESEAQVIVDSPAVEWWPIPSPDGKYLLYVSEESGQQEIYATTYPGLIGRWQVSRGGGGWTAWRGDGREIYYCTHNEMFSVSVDYENGFTLGRPQKMFDRPSTDWSSAWPDGFDVTADGQRFVMLRPAPTEEDAQPMLMVVQNWFAEFGGK
jgi:serine/threonine protein kinase